MRRFFGPRGSVSRIALESSALKSNMLGDPSVRVVDVYLPAGHDGEGLPLLVDLVGFTSSGLSDTNWVGFRENLPERLDRLIGEQRMPPVVVAFPDCFTRLGGNQYINSASNGPCHAYPRAAFLWRRHPGPLPFRPCGLGRRPAAHSRLAPRVSYRVACGGRTPLAVIHARRAIPLSAVGGGG